MIHIEREHVAEEIVAAETRQYQYPESGPWRRFSNGQVAAMVIACSAVATAILLIVLSH